MTLKRLQRSVLQAFILLVISAGLGFALNQIGADSPPQNQPAEPGQTASTEPWIQLQGEAVLQHLNEGTGIIIDARDPADYEAGHILGAMNVPESNFEQEFAELRTMLPKDQLYIVYCSGGACSQSHEVLARMHELGFEKLAIYEGGWQDWQENGFPTG